MLAIVPTAPEAGDGAGEAMRGNAHAHPALHDRQRAPAADHERRQIVHPAG